MDRYPQDFVPHAALSGQRLRGYVDEAHLDQSFVTVGARDEHGSKYIVSRAIQAS